MATIDDKTLQVTVDQVAADLERMAQAANEDDALTTWREFLQDLAVEASLVSHLVTYAREALPGIAWHIPDPPTAE